MAVPHKDAFSIETSLPPGKLLYAGVSSRRLGKVSDSLPEGFTSPSRTHQRRSRLPFRDRRLRPRLHLIQPGHSHRRANVKHDYRVGVGFSHRADQLILFPVNSMSGRSLPSDSYPSGKPAKITATSDFLARQLLWLTGHPLQVWARKRTRKLSRRNQLRWV